MDILEMPIAVNKVLKSARANTNSSSCDMSELKLVELHSIEVLNQLKDKLHPALASKLDNPSDREDIEIDIEIGIEFAFWYDNRGYLVFER